MIPTRVTPDDEQIRGDDWSCQILLDPSRDWSGSTFTVDTEPVGIGVQVDESHRADPTAPYVLLTLPGRRSATVQAGWFRWNLAEDVVTGRTFLSRVVDLVNR